MVTETKKWDLMSHPTWVRGLKHGEFKYTLKNRVVAPYVGAWIETSFVISIINIL